MKMMEQTTPDRFAMVMRHWEMYDKLYDQGDYKGLIELQKKYIAMFPGNYRDELFLADAYGYDGQDEQAMKILKKLHKRDPWDYEVVNAIVECLFRLDEDPSDFQWRRPVSLITTRTQALDWTEDYLKVRGNHQELFDLYCAMEDVGYVRYDLQTYEDYLMSDARFFLTFFDDGDVIVELNTSGDHPF